MTTEIRDANREAWNARRFEAWVEAMGDPAVEAGRIVADPHHVLRRLITHLGDFPNRRICSVQGSHGRVAVALSLLGADVTVIDFAEENRRYANALANAAKVRIRYEVADIMEAGNLGLPPFHTLVLELGVLHYHQDLKAFFGVMARLCEPGGRLVLNEFHPVERKLFHDFGDAPRDYFNPRLVFGEVPNPVSGGENLGTCAYRFWTLAEVVSALLASGFHLNALEEHPDWSNPSIPGTYTLVATYSP
jgi:2-polyprenyl-3-methyl-5-hydroxy-6-metoxy-1,4-benzoquinol methylase